MLKAEVEQIRKMAIRITAIEIKKVTIDIEKLRQQIITLQKKAEKPLPGRQVLNKVKEK